MEQIHRDRAMLDEGLEAVRAAPSNEGRVEKIVLRPDVDQREEPASCEVSPARGMHGDRWEQHQLKHGTANQIAIMNSRVARLIAVDESRWALAGDNLFVDLDLSEENMPAGRKLRIGTALLEVTEMPHNGCKKFAKRFGTDAVVFVNTPQGKALHLRGVYVRVIEAGTIRLGDTASLVD